MLRIGSSLVRSKICPQVLIVMTVLPLFLNVLAEQQVALERPVDAAPAPLPVPNPTKSFWIDTPGANPLAKEGSEGPLTADADIAIIGSGISGVSAAYHLSRLLAETGEAERPLKVVILEARDFCMFPKILPPSVSTQPYPVRFWRYWKEWWASDGQFLQRVHCVFRSFRRGRRAARNSS
ncbi:hypothetical protein FKP32DRAFT_28341 [Trametes sanguinea]|nr:hypothetical protein FKP32DRAFT_28341 [Trametes sanguinea]